MVRIVSAVLTAFLLSLGLAGCGEQESTEADDADTFEPYTRETLLVAMGKAVESHPTVRMQFEGAGEKMDLRMRMGGVDEVAMSGTIEGDDEPFEMILVGSEVYGRDQGDEKYMRFPDDISGPILADMGDMSPQGMIDDMRDSIETMEYVGAETLDGAEVQRYDVTVSQAALVEKLGAKAKGLRVTYRMWLDERDLITKMTVAVMGVEMVATMSEWGEPFDVKAPPASQVEAFPGA
ncbi:MULTISPECIES: hypothetical protein [unclassified Nocardioides]|uniref:hypothetical protein n=1 Tax=unclassified Nocardioides TaxID=2615069 RepID=UPI0007031F8C|nr:MULTISPECIES: hypothetical protein [unclassified Nocardioides]KRC51453.1 hypothetical protein ASE19_15330 [Nocardioides sp. Root79]KRC69061.1 hypothetical protein ASE20_15985 [Nocardioides sp. Root240]